MKTLVLPCPRSMGAPRRQGSRSALWHVAVAIGATMAVSVGMFGHLPAAVAATQSRLTILPSEDGYVSQRYPATTFNSDRLTAGSAAGDRKVIYLKFTVPKLPASAGDATARVVLRRDLHKLPGSVELSAVSNTGWTDQTLTMQNAPAVGARLDVVAPSPTDAQVSLLLSTQVQPGTYTVAVTSAATNDVARFRSVEYGTDRPRLVISYKSNGNPPPGSLAGTWVGAAVNERLSDGSTDASIEQFMRADALIGPLAFRRSFDSRLPATFADSAARYDAANGVRSFVSWKPPNGDFVGAAQGKYDAQVTQWAKSVPTTGVYATSFHEPENDMTGAQFVAMQRHLYVVVKAANPSIQWGPVYMSYWWNPAAGGHYIGSPDAWWVGSDYADFTAVDTYSASRPVPLAEDPEFRGWYDYMLGRGLPMLIAEYGQYAVPAGKQADPAMLSLRAEVIAADAQWIASAGTISMWLYWNAYGDQGNWRLEDTASQRAWHNAADAGRTK